MKRLTSPRVVLALGLACVFAAGVVISAQRATATMASAATSFLNALTPEQRAQATFPMESEERMRFNFIPTETFPRKGVLLKDMTEPQRKLAHALLRKGDAETGGTIHCSGTRTGDGVVRPRCNQRVDYWIVARYRSLSRAAS